MGKAIYSPSPIRVKILGLVQNPGIYTMENGESLGDLLEKAGRIPGKEKEEESWDLDTLLLDGQVIELK